MSKKHPGFDAVAKKIQAEGYSADTAAAILADKTRGASKKAKKANPNLKNVLPKKHHVVHSNGGSKRP